MFARYLNCLASLIPTIWLELQNLILDRKYSERVQLPWKFVANTWQHLLNSWISSSSSECRNANHFVSVKVWFSVSGIIVRSSIKCKQSPVYIIFWPLLPLPSTDSNETRTWSSLFPRNLPIKFGTNPSTIFLVIVVTDRYTRTDRQTYKPTPVKTYSLAFAWKIRVTGHMTLTMPVSG